MNRFKIEIFVHARRDVDNVAQAVKESLEPGDSEVSVFTVMTEMSSTGVCLPGRYKVSPQIIDTIELIRCGRSAGDAND
jgi:hypothetical protein